MATKKACFPFVQRMAVHSPPGLPPPGDLTRAKGLPDLIAQHIRIPPLFPARDSLVLCLCQKKLGVGGTVVALIGGNQFAALGFLRVLSIVKTVFQRLGNGFPLADMMGH